MDGKIITLNDLSAYKLANELSDYVWDVVSKWDWFSKKTFGIQFVTAIDSSAANIAEGFGRFHRKDKQKFFYNARGSVYESIYWREKAFKRKCLTEEQNNYIQERLDLLPREINILIKLTNNLKE